MYHPYNHQLITDKKDMRPLYHGPPSHNQHNRPQAYNTWYKEKHYRPTHFHSKPGFGGPVYEKPNLNQYEEIFSHQFLDPPKPGGFQQLKTLPRHWPVSYLHKETPPNATVDIESVRIEDKNSRKFNRNQNQNNNAVNNLKQTIKTEEKEYTNSSNILTQESLSKDEDELLLVRIPMPVTSNENKEKKLEVIDTNITTRIKHLDKSKDFDDLFLISLPRNKYNITGRKTDTTLVTIGTPKRDLQVFPIRRGYVTRANRTVIRRKRLQKLEH